MRFPRLLGQTLFRWPTSLHRSGFEVSNICSLCVIRVASRSRSARRASSMLAIYRAASRFAISLNAE